MLFLLYVCFSASSQGSARKSGRSGMLDRHISGRRGAQKGLLYRLLEATALRLDATYRNAIVISGIHQWIVTMLCGMEWKRVVSRPSSSESVRPASLINALPNLNWRRACIGV